jgi:hypothetical protein
MKFYRLGEIPTRSGDLVFKASATGPLIGFILFCGIAIVLLLFGMSGEKIYGLNLPPAFFIYVGAPTFGLLGWIACGQLRARLKPTNWLLRCDSSGVIIKYRSFENWRFPVEDVQVVGFDYAEVGEIRMAREQRATPGLGGNQTDQIEYLTYLDFCLADTDTSALEAHLQAEQKAEPLGRFKTIYRDYPVEVLPGGIVRLRWSMDGRYKIRPSPQKAIEYLSKFVVIAGADATEVDLTYQSNLSPEEGDAKILTLAKSGDKMGAVKLTRQIYGSTLSEAVAFVERLQSGG